MPRRARRRDARGPGCPAVGNEGRRRSTRAFPAFHTSGAVGSGETVGGSRRSAPRVAPPIPRKQGQSVACVEPVMYWRRWSGIDGRDLVAPGEVPGALRRWYSWWDVARGGFVLGGGAPHPPSGHPLPGERVDRRMRLPRMSSSTRSHRMTHGPPMKFTKMHGIGNDYVYVEPLRPAGPGRPRGAGGRGQRPALRRRLRRADPDRPVRARRRPDADVQRRRLRVGDVRQRRPLRRQVRLRPRPRAEGPGDGRDRPRRPDARPGSRGREGPPGPRRHGRADPAGRPTSRRRCPGDPPVDVPVPVARARTPR